MYAVRLDANRGPFVCPPFPLCLRLLYSAESNTKHDLIVSMLSCLFYFVYARKNSTIVIPVCFCLLCLDTTLLRTWHLVCAAAENRMHNNHEVFVKTSTTYFHITINVSGCGFICCWVYCIQSSVLKKEPE